MKAYQPYNVLEAAKQRIRIVFDSFERVYVAFSGGKDSTVLLHLAVEEAARRGRKLGVLVIDLEAQYQGTVRHIETCVQKYKEHIDLHWICAELLLRNAVSNYQPRWTSWDETQKPLWVRPKPPQAADLMRYDFYVPQLEFEEFVVLFGQWYARGQRTACMVGIRADESLSRYFVVARSSGREGLNGYKWTTGITDTLCNVYPLYDWRTQDIWIYQGRNPEKPCNPVYAQMTRAGVKLADQRLCQPFGDDQRRGLWLYHVLEPETWAKLVLRVNGANSGALFAKESGNATGSRIIVKPVGHTWQSFCRLLLCTLVPSLRDNYMARFHRYIAAWKQKGYAALPDEAPLELELGNRGAGWAPSWRCLCRAVLRNDYWCRGLGQSQPKSEAWALVKELRKARISN